MRRAHLIGIESIQIVFLILLGCMEREPAPVCSTPLTVSTIPQRASGFDGVDLLVVVDNSSSMETEQQILATGFYTLINSLIKPLSNDKEAFSAVENMRVAIVSTDMGLQYGEDGSLEGFPYGLKVPGCADRAVEDARGDNAKFLARKRDVTRVPIESGTIPCEVDGEQCPDEEWTCKNGLCMPPAGSDEINCVTKKTSSGFIETTEDTVNRSFINQIACAAQQGISGCGIEQQLEASYRGLSNHPDFLVDTHLLAVLIVSDEEDCSVKSKKLFETTEFNDSDLLNTACNYPEKNEKYLFEPERYYEKLISLKNNQANAVIFTAIVGVPNQASLGGRTSPCEGQGDIIEAAGCLEHEKMQISLAEYEDPVKMTHFAFACERRDKSNTLLTRAFPGRRFVKVAEEFGSNAYVYSICNEDWSPAMKKIAGIIARQLKDTCFSSKLDWGLLSEKERAEFPDCENCGLAKCDVIVEQDYDLATTEYCPDEFKGDDPEAYNKKIHPEDIKEGQEIVGKRVNCPLPKLPAPLDCEAADKLYQNTQKIGWYYCENKNVSKAEDCDDDEDCDDTCEYSVKITERAQDKVRYASIGVQCVQQFHFQDSNCQENSQRICQDEKDNDGNGVFDCDNTLYLDVENPHRPDPHCCPMTVDKDNKCQIDPNTYKICPGSDKENPPDACEAHKELLGCEW